MTSLLNRLYSRWPLLTTICICAGGFLLVGLIEGSF